MSRLFTDSQSVVDFGAADVAKKEANAIGVLIYDAVVVKHSRRPASRHQRRRRLQFDRRRLDCEQLGRCPSQPQTLPRFSAKKFQRNIEERRSGDSIGRRRSRRRELRTEDMSVDAQDVDEDTPWRCALIVVLLRLSQIFHEYDKSALHETAGNIDCMITCSATSEWSKTSTRSTTRDRRLSWLSHVWTRRVLKPHAMFYNVELKSSATGSSKRSRMFIPEGRLFFTTSTSLNATPTKKIGRDGFVLGLFDNVLNVFFSWKTPLALAAKEGRLKMPSSWSTRQNDSALAAGQFHRDVVDFIDAVNDKQRSEDSALRHQALMSKVQCKSYPTSSGVVRPPPSKPSSAVLAANRPRESSRMPPSSSDGSMSSLWPPHVASEANSDLNFSSTSSSCGSRSTQPDEGFERHRQQVDLIGACGSMATASWLRRDAFKKFDDTTSTFD